MHRPFRRRLAVSKRWSGDLFHRRPFLAGIRQKQLWLLGKRAWASLRAADHVAGLTKRKRSKSEKHRMCNPNGFWNLRRIQEHLTLAAIFQYGQRTPDCSWFGSKSREGIKVLLCGGASGGGGWAAPKVETIASFALSHNHVLGHAC